MFGVCILCLSNAWRCSYYHRLILPTNGGEQHKLEINDFDQFKIDIANCHNTMYAICVLISCIDNIDIVNIILCYAAQIK